MKENGMAHWTISYETNTYLLKCTKVMGYNCEAAINRWNNTALHNHFLSQGTHLLYLEHPHYPNFFLHLNTFIRGYSQNQPDFLTLPEQWQLNIYLWANTWRINNKTRFKPVHIQLQLVQTYKWLNICLWKHFIKWKLFEFLRVFYRRKEQAGLTNVTR